MMLFLLKLVAVIVVVVTGIILSLQKGKDGDVEGLSIPKTVGTVFAAIAAMVLLSSFGTIGAGERGVVTRFGAATGRIVEPGIYAVTPLVEGVHPMNVQIQKGEVTTSAASKDLQEVTSDFAINYHANPNMVATLYKTVGDDYETKIIAPSALEAMKASTAKYNAEDLVTQRESVRQDFQNSLTQKLAPYGIVLDATNMKDFQFSKSFSEAIENKVTAVQNALGAENKLKQVQYEADQRVAQAKGEAEAIKIQAEAITQQGGQAYVQLQAIEKWNGELPTYMMGNGGAVPFVNIGNK